MGRDNTGGWCVLRTGEAATLRLMRMLCHRGFEAWTPIVKASRRVPRSHVVAMMETALAPSFVFARYEALPALRALSLDPQTRPRFSLFRYRPPGGDKDIFPRVRDADLDRVRVAEAEFGARSGQTAFAKGDKVTMNAGAFEGLTGEVARTKGTFSLVLFAGFHIPVQIPTWKLKGVQLGKGQP